MQRDIPADHDGETGGIVYDEQAALYPGAEYPETENLKTEILLMDSDLDEYQKTDGDTSKGIVSERELEARMIAMRIRELLRSQKSWIRRPANSEMCVIRIL